MAATNTPSPGRKGDKIIRDALMAVQRNDPDRLRRVALAWWDAAETDQIARNALADRLDGKAMQPIAHQFAPETQNDESLDAQLAQLARKAGIAIIASGEARAEDAQRIPGIH